MKIILIGIDDALSEGTIDALAGRLRERAEYLGMMLDVETVRRLEEISNIPERIMHGCSNEMPPMPSLLACMGTVDELERRHQLDNLALLAGKIAQNFEGIEDAFSRLRNSIEHIPKITAEQLRAGFPEAPKNPYAAKPRGFQGYMKRANRQRY